MIFTEVEQRSMRPDRLIVDERLRDLAQETLRDICGLFDEYTRRRRETDQTNAPHDRDTMIIRRFLAGETQTVIGESYGLTHQRIQQILKDHGINRYTRKVTPRSNL